MKIATWNVNSIRVRIEQLCEFLKCENIDVVLLQELKCPTELFPNEAFEDIGYNCAVFGQKTYNGVAILSKYLIEDIRIGSEIFCGDSQSRYIDAFINGYRIASVYVPNGQAPNLPAYGYKLDFLGRLINHVERTIENETYIIGGDFNIALTDLDVYNPKLWHNKICCTNSERSSLRDFISVGLVDVARKFSSDPIYTWWDYRTRGFSKNHGLRLDYIFTTSSVNSVSSYVDLEVRAKERTSDHAPVVAEIRETIV